MTIHDTTSRTTMNRLLIVRHGEAQDYLPDRPDFNRHLTQQGRDRLRATAQTLIDELCMPSHIVASAAVRTHETAEILAHMFGLGSSHISYQTELYGASADVLLNCINELQPRPRTLMLVAHNPGVHELHCLLSQEHHKMFPTGGIAVYSILDPERGVEPSNVKLDMTFFR